MMDARAWPVHGIVYVADVVAESAMLRTNMAYRKPAGFRDRSEGFETEVRSRQAECGSLNEQNLGKL